jgi:Fur family peroxide stress response transcriptional regulator
MIPLKRPQIEQLFEDRGVRCTPQRFVVMNFLVQNPVHATADEIFEAVNRLDPRASRATIYNSLKALVGAGLVREVALEGRAARFDADIGKHHHFICDACGELEDIEWFDIPRPGRTALGSRTVRDCELILRGLCASCQSSKTINHRYSKEKS